MNLLLIDAGNTQVKWAVCRDDLTLSTPMNWHAHGQFSSQDISPEALAFLQNHSIDTVLISSVLLEHETIKLQASIRRYCTAPCHMMDGTVGLDHLPTRYSNPIQLGADRRSMLLAAHQLYRDEHLIILCAGTATTIDVLSSNLGHLGGWILPGLGMSMSALAYGTANLNPQLNVNFQEHALGLTTDQAIQQGIFVSQCAAIEYASRIAQELHTPIARILVDGGYGPAFLNHIHAQDSQARCIHTPQLCLMGLLVWHQEVLKK